jgi:hypothetical protein
MEHCEHEDTLVECEGVLSRCTTALAAGHLKQTKHTSLMKGCVL